MAETTSDLLVDRLIAWKVDTVFGLPGDGINGIMEALRTRQKEIRFIQVRHEEAAAFMACGYAKFTGRLGVCLATSGPGAIHLLNGLYDAKLDHIPVLAITGMQYHDLIGTDYQQDVMVDYLFQDVALYNQRVMGPAHVVNAVDLAIRRALTHRGVAHITIPVDFQEKPVKKDTRSMRNIKGHVNTEFTPPVQVPVKDQLQRAAEMLSGCTKPVIMAGDGARGARRQIEEVAEIIGAPIIKPLLGKDVIPDNSPYTLGGIGLLGTRPSSNAMQDCDGLLMVGTSFPYMEYLPEPGQAQAVQIDTDPAKIGLRYPVTVGLCADAKATLEGLIPLLKRNENREFLQQCQGEYQEWLKLMEERGTRDDQPMKPQRVAHELSKLLTDDAIITSDSGTIATWAARQIMIRNEQRFSLSGNLATMANGFPYAIAAQAAFPNRQCVAFVGDGGLSMLMAELATCVKYNLPVKVVVIKNNTLGMIKWEQMVFLGNPEYGVELQPIDFIKIAEGCGARGVHIENPDTCSAQIREALEMPGPVVIEAVVDPFEAPMPPKIKPKQAKNMTEALARGEPNANRIGLTLYRDMVSETAYSESPAGVVGRAVHKVGQLVNQENPANKDGDNS